MPASQSISDSASQSSQLDPLRRRVSAAFERLVASAAELNAVSDQLAKPISAIEAALKRLNLGVTAWITFQSILHDSEDYRDNHEYHEICCIGYAKISQRWGLAISHATTVDGEAVKQEEWPFSDAPRALRLEALEKLPELLEKLAESSSETATTLKKRIALTQQVADTIGRMAPSKPARGK